jgi:hypothetical protein
MATGKFGREIPGATKTSGVPSHSNALKSDVSGHAHTGKTPSSGKGGNSPTAASAADKAAGGNNKSATNIPGRHNP